MTSRSRRLCWWARSRRIVDNPDAYVNPNPDGIRCPYCGAQPEHVHHEPNRVLGKHRMECDACGEDFLDPYREEEEP